MVQSRKDAIVPVLSENIAAQLVQFLKLGPERVLQVDEQFAQLVSFVGLPTNESCRRHCLQ